MPWQEQGSGFTTSRGGHISNVPQYEKLKAKYGKARAAAITNSFHSKRGPKRKDEMAKAAGDGGASQILVLQGPRESIAKYQRGTITQHQEQASLHARKKSSGRRQVAAGTTAAGLGLAAHAAKANNPRAFHSLVDDAKDIHPPVAARATVKLLHHGPAGLIAGGLGLAGAGAARAGYHGSRQNRETRAAQAARKQRNASLGKSAAGEFTRGVRTGVHLANQGHSPIGPFGSGVAGRKTYTVRPGGSKAKRAGIHLGVTGAQTPVLVPVAAVSAAGGAGAVHHHMRKAVDHHDAAAAFLGGGAAGSGTSAVQAHRRARAQRQGSAKLHEEARDHFRIVENRVARQLMKPGTKGALARTTPAMHSTARELFQGRAQDKQASALARDAITSGRKAKGRAGAAVLLAGGATAAASRRDRSPRYSSVGYR